MRRGASRWHCASARAPVCVYVCVGGERVCVVVYFLHRRRCVLWTVVYAVYLQCQARPGLSVALPVAVRPLSPYGHRALKPRTWLSFGSGEYDPKTKNHLKVDFNTQVSCVMTHA